MQTNGANGHQHEASEKRLAPGAFPYRLDMEICACGAKRWVDQDGTPATPWQSINLGTVPGGNEGAGVAPRAPPKSALDGLITCGSCGQPMLLDDTQGDQEACYACQSRCPTPRGCTPAPTGMNRPWNSQSSRPCGQTPRVRVNPDGGPVQRLRGGKPRQDGVNFRLDLRPDRAHRAGTTAARPTSPRPVWPMRRAMTSQTNPHGWTGDPEARWGPISAILRRRIKGSLGNILSPAPTRGSR